MQNSSVTIQIRFIQSIQAEPLCFKFEMALKWHHKQQWNS